MQRLMQVALKRQVRLGAEQYRSKWREGYGVLGELVNPPDCKSGVVAARPSSNLGDPTIFGMLPDRRQSVLVPLITGASNG